MTHPMRALDVSVVIPTHNRRALLLRALEAFEAQSLSAERFEVIVVFDDCTDGSQTAVSARSWAFELSAVPVAVRSAAAARNAGANRARGARILFLDDDIGVGRTFLEAHLNAAGPAGIPIVLGPIIPEIEGKGWFYDKVRGWWANFSVAKANPGHRFQFTDLATGNVSIARSDFHRLGGFNETLAVREDYELGWRAIAAGIPMTVARDAPGHHRDDSDFPRNLRRVHAEGGSDVVFARLHPESFRTMRVAGLEARTASSAVLRFLGFDAPWLYPPLMATISGLLPIAERLRLQGLWNRLAEAAWGFSYHRGAAAALGSRAALRDLAWAAPARRSTSLCVDLADGVASERVEVEAVQPDELVIQAGGSDMGRIAEWPGMEPLAGRHLDEWLRQNSGWWERVVIAANRLPQVPAVSPVLPEAGHLSVGTLDLSDWSIRAVRRPLAYPVMALVRWHDEALGWINLNAADVQGGKVLGCARKAILGNIEICDRLVRIAAAGPQPVPAELPPISVVVCSRDRTENLAECLAALSVMDYPDYEVIVVDNAPATDATERLVASLPGVRYVREDRPGLDWARNHGFSVARHGIVAYTDDDTRADRFWLRGIARGFADSGVAAVTGLVTPMEVEGLAQDYFEFVYGGMGKGLVPKIWSLAEMGPRGILWSSACGVGANMAFRRNVLTDLGGFDPALDVGTATRGGGDIEMFHSLLARGHVLRYEPSAIVWHRHRSDWEGLAGQLQDNGSGFGAYLLTAWRTRSVPRHHILAFALRDWIWGWQVRRLLRPGRHYRDLVWREVKGMLSAQSRLNEARAIVSDLHGTGREEGADTTADHRMASSGTR